MANGLLNCPFCGSPARIDLFEPLLPNGMRDTLYVARCSLRECGAMTQAWYPREAAASAWNRRTEAGK